VQFAGRMAYTPRSGDHSDSDNFLGRETGGQESFMVRVIQAVSLGVVVFLCCRWLALRLAPLMGENVNVARQWAFKTLIVAASLAIWACTRRTWAEMGWKRPRRGVRLFRWYALAALAMGVGSIVLIWTGSRHPLVAEMSFPEIVVTIWLLSSIAEEIFVRGLIQ
jgi:membrane protease YdiL (CAAX protease family)